MRRKMTFENHQAMRRGITQHFKNLSVNGYTLYAVSITYKHPRRNEDGFRRKHVGMSVSTLDIVLHSIYIGFCKNLVHQHNFARPSYRNLMPTLFAVAERDGNCELHHHGILAVRSDIANRAQALMGENALCPLHDSVKTSDIKPIWLLEGWTDYICPPASLWDTPSFFSPKFRDALADSSDQLEVVQ